MNVPFAALWEDLVQAICRPYRIEYSTADLIGGRKGVFSVNGLKGSREDFVITNKKEEKLQCSQWQLSGSSGEMPCVIYCHCNSGSRMDAEEAIGHLLPLGIRVFALDFTGSGQSDGEYVTLGAYEVNDLQALVEFIRQGGHTSLIALWGRSMGAVTALLYAVRDPTVAAIVLDSPFSRLIDLMWEILEERKIPLRKLLGKTAFMMMRRSVKKRAGFDIQAISPIDHVGGCFTPALFAHATGDNFVKCSHTERLHEAYAGEKRLVLFDGDHNSSRPRKFYSEAVRFLARALHLDQQLGSFRDGLDRVDSPEASDRALSASTGHTHQPWGELHIGPADVESLRVALTGLSPTLTDADLGVVDITDLELQAALALSIREQTARASGSSDSTPAPESATDESVQGGATAPAPAARGGLNDLDGVPPAPTAAPDPGGGVRGGAAHCHRRPVSRAEEDEMLRAAIEASLAEVASQEGEQRLAAVASTADDPAARQSANGGAALAGPERSRREARSGAELASVDLVTLSEALEGDRAVDLDALDVARVLGAAGRS